MSEILRKLTALLRRERWPAVCAAWGCLSPVGIDSIFGPGPVCVPCVEHLRPVPLDEREHEQLRGRER